ncbi:MAG: AAA family ATPase [Pirellulales bacterium]|nr:AAA family ATPase [Pirellulales bacterium]
MATSDDAIRALRAAVSVSPDNVPLRQHLAESLLGLGRGDEAEVEYRAALGTSPNDAGLKLGLARAFNQQGKHSHALVIVEDLLKLPQPPAAAHLLYARFLLSEGDVQRAVTHYRQAQQVDPTARDEELAAQLGIDAQPEDELADGRIRLGRDTDAASSIERVAERPQINFNDVGGMEPLKEEIRLKIIYPIEHAEMFRAYGKPVGGGILMYGPPGCGKTYLARATAGEIKAEFLAVGINDVLEMWFGNSERNLHELFERARRQQPCVLFFDEIDALGASRTDMRQSAGRQLINQFLAELDGVDSSNDGVLILGATNAPWHLDNAFRRPGRFDRIVFVPPPDAAARAGILRVLCRGKPLGDIDYDAVARKTDGFSGADLKNTLDLAIEEILHAAVRGGAPRPLSTKDLLAAAKRVRPSTAEWFATARNYALYSNQGGIYDDILKYLKL